MVEVAIIADDLTGAADTGVQFCPYFRDTVLMPYSNISSDPDGVLSSPLQALAVYTNSRSLNAGQSRDRLCAVARQLLLLQPKHIYKKIDSCIRGNLGAEVEAIMDEMGYEVSFIAPAFPEMGRTTFHDVHLVDGVPVALTELSQDPVTPLTESRLSRVVSLGSHYKVSHVDFQFVDGTEEVLAAEIDRLVHCGARHLVFDTINQTHLDRIVHLGLAWPKKALLVGSAGLAKSFGCTFPRQPLPGGYDFETVPAGNHLLVCGSISERTNIQLSVLMKTYPYEVIYLQPHLLANSAGRDELLLYVRGVQSALSKNSLIIRIGDKGMQGIERPEAMKPWSAEEIVRGLGVFVEMVLRNAKPASLFLTGGDTANAVMASIGIKGVRLFGEIVPGVVHGIVTGGMANGLSVVTKAGAFGNENTLIALHEYWENKKRGSLK